MLRPKQLRIPGAKGRSGKLDCHHRDLLQGIVKEVNPAAEKLGLKVGLTGREASNCC